MRRSLYLIAPALLVAGLIWVMLPPDQRSVAIPARSPSPPAVPVDGGAQTADVGASASSGAVAEPGVTHAVSASGVAIRLQRNPRIDLPEPPYQRLYEALKDRVEQAPPRDQYVFGLLLYQCRDVPEDQAELERQVERVHQTRRLDGWDVSDPVQEEQSLRRGFADCVGIPAESRQQHRQWMKRAAQNGLIEAQLNLMYYLPKAEYCQFIEDCSPQQAQLMAQLREEARSNVDQAMQAGSVEALRTVGSWALNEEMGAPDFTEAYAYLSAYDQVQQAAGREREVQRMLDQLRTRLRPVDLDLAEAKARELLSNPNCCVLTR